MVMVARCFLASPTDRSLNSLTTYVSPSLLILSYLLICFPSLRLFLVLRHDQGASHHPPVGMHLKRGEFIAYNLLHTLLDAVYMLEKGKDQLTD